jgi:hypothetical protein
MDRHAAHSRNDVLLGKKEASTRVPTVGSPIASACFEPRSNFRPIRITSDCVNIHITHSTERFMSFARKLLHQLGEISLCFREYLGTEAVVAVAAVDRC